MLSRTMDASVRRQNASLRGMNTKQDGLKDDTLLVCVCVLLFTYFYPKMIGSYYYSRLSLLPNNSSCYKLALSSQTTPPAIN